MRNLLNKLGVSIWVGQVCCDSAYLSIPSSRTWSLACRSSKTCHNNPHLLAYELSNQIIMSAPHCFITFGTATPGLTLCQVTWVVLRLPFFATTTSLPSCNEWFHFRLLTETQRQSSFFAYRFRPSTLFHTIQDCHTGSKPLSIHLNCPQVVLLCHND